MTITAHGELLTASTDDRTLTYRLLPYGEPGRTSAGTITAAQGTVTVPEDVAGLPVNLEHDYKRPVGKFVSVTETENGLEATIRVANTRDGDDALTLAAEGLRRGISVEIDSPVIRAGRLISGVLTAAGLVVRSAFPSAQLVAADSGDLPTEMETNMENETPETVEVSTPQAAPLKASDSRVELGALTFEALQNGESVKAALADAVPADHEDSKIYIGEQSVGELWEARKSERPFVESIGVKPLNSLYVSGTRKERTFAVADWAGSKTELPTGKFTSSKEDWKASAKAVAVDIATELIEFGDESVISDHYEQAMDSYVEQTETELIAAVSTAATVVTGQTNVIGAVNKGAEVLGGIGAKMSFVICSPDVYAGLVNIKGNDAPWWLQAQSNVSLGSQTANVGGITITSDPQLAAGTVLVGDKRAVDYRESRDFRYRALDVAHGGVDISLIKFRATKVTDSGAILKFTGVTAPVETPSA
ncbi:hypothetical protein F7P69_00770 [Cellulosimicrobium funkei]|nr:hypothetical protein [Cellulosimicrobium funkei]